jgi:hypothetical protein
MGPVMSKHSDDDRSSNPRDGSYQTDDARGVRTRSGGVLLIEEEGKRRPLLMSDLEQIISPLVDSAVNYRLALSGRPASLFQGTQLQSRAAEIERRAIDIFGDKAKAHAWLQRPSVKLGGVRPVDHLDTDEHANAVEGALDAIAYGAPV